MSPVPSKIKKLVFNLLGFLFGFLASAFVVFQILFLAKVIPHGGI